MIALCGVAVSVFAYVALTDIAIDKRVISNYFGNIAFAYEDYGFPYCFTASLFNTGISEPVGYSEETMAKIGNDGAITVNETGRSEEELPNIFICAAGILFRSDRSGMAAVLGRSDPELTRNVQQIFQRIFQSTDRSEPEPRIPSLKY